MIKMQDANCHFFLKKIAKNVTDAHTIEYYSVRKSNQLLKYIIMDLKRIILSEEKIYSQNLPIIQFYLQNIQEITKL